MLKTDEKTKKNEVMGTRKKVLLQQAMEWPVGFNAWIRLDVKR